MVYTPWKREYIDTAVSIIPNSDPWIVFVPWKREHICAAVYISPNSDSFNCVCSLEDGTYRRRCFHQSESWIVLLYMLLRRWKIWVSLCPSVRILVPFVFLCSMQKGAYRRCCVHQPWVLLFYPTIIVPTFSMSVGPTVPPSSTNCVSARDLWH